MQAVCDQEKISKSELTLPTENPPVVLESEILSRKSTKYSEKLSSTKRETKRSKQSSVSLEKGKQALKIEKRRQELEKESRRIQYELEEKKRQLEDDLKMLRMQEELQFAGEENTNESNSEDSREACSEISKHESVRKWFASSASASGLKTVNRPRCGPEAELFFTLFRRLDKGIPITSAVFIIEEPPSISCIAFSRLSEDQESFLVVLTRTFGI
ncbi:hypothetical protein JTB14_015105 [Gonioctena quinquepunctata]|nr:hypothetical protein JTB14_015105 [Gonioctena quinquepunctata]